MREQAKKYLKLQNEIVKIVKPCKKNQNAIEELKHTRWEKINNKH